MKNDSDVIPILLFILGLCLVSAAVLRGPETRQAAGRGRNALEVTLGFVGWFGVNTQLWIWVLANESGSIILNPFRLMPLCTDVPLLLVLGMRRRWIFLGVVGAMLINAIGTLLFTGPGPYLDQRFGHVITMTPFFLPYLV